MSIEPMNWGKRVTINNYHIVVEAGTSGLFKMTYTNETVYSQTNQTQTADYICVTAVQGAEECVTLGYLTGWVTRQAKRYCSFF